MKMAQQDQLTLFEEVPEHNNQSLKKNQHTTIKQWRMRGGGNTLVLLAQLHALWRYKKNRKKKGENTNISKDDSRLTVFIYRMKKE